MISTNKQTTSKMNKLQFCEHWRWAKRATKSGKPLKEGTERFCGHWWQGRKEILARVLVLEPSDGRILCDHLTINCINRLKGYTSLSWTTIIQVVKLRVTWRLLGIALLGESRWSSNLQVLCVQTCWLTNVPSLTCFSSFRHWISAVKFPSFRYWTQILKRASNCWKSFSMASLNLVTAVWCFPWKTKC